MRLVTSIGIALLLSACGGGSSSPAVNPVVNPPNVDPPVTGPPREPGELSITRSGSEVIGAKVNGGTQSVLITFLAQDERNVDTLQVTQGLTSLPAGWQGPASFSCLDISQSNTCTLSLNFTPTAVAQGTVNLSYEYATAGSAAASGALEIPFSATASNNVATTVTPMGPIVGVLSGHQSVLINFSSDDGNALRDLELMTDLDGLPAGWSSESTSFACAEVTTGSGCQLALDFSPGTYGEGTLSLSYEYSDNSGAPKSGTLELPYLARVHNQVVVTASPTPFNVPIGSAQAFTFTFTTDDGHPMRWVEVLTDLENGLQEGWSAPVKALRCENVSTGNGCQLVLQYAPTGPVTETDPFFLQFGWEDGAGRTDNASYAIGYQALTDNAVIGTSAPSGQVTAVVGGTQPVRVSFTSDDNRNASNFAVDTDLTALPAGWSAQNTVLQCALIHSGPHCYLDLSYAPGAVASGTLMLNFSYTNNAGTPRNGTVSIPYAATTDNNIVVTQAPAGTLIARHNTPLNFSLTFTSDDGESITGFTTTTHLNSISPINAVGGSSKVCATVSDDASCVLNLRFQPNSTVRSGTASIGYSYTNNSGQAKTGTVSLPYEGWPGLVYIGNDGGTINRCEFNPDTGTLFGCGATGFTGSGVNDLAFSYLYSSYQVYVADSIAGEISLCTIEPNGAFTGCTVQVSSIPNPIAIDTANSNWVYIVSGHASHGVYGCQRASDNTLSNCTAAGIPYGVRDTIAAAGLGYLYADYPRDRLLACSSNNSTGAMTCSPFYSVPDPYGLFNFGGNIYILSPNQIRACDINYDVEPYVLDSCVINNFPGIDIRGMSQYNGRALLTTGTGVMVCDMTPESEFRSMGSCRDSGAPAAADSTTSIVTR